MLRLVLAGVMLLTLAFSPHSVSAQYPAMGQYALGFPADYTGQPVGYPNPYFSGVAYPGYNTMYAAFSAYPYPSYFGWGSPSWYGYPGYGFGFGW
jgi:hypothetical protein